ncbi:conserved hypothetical protein [Ricinus communis]|uniref:Uncharacterized protein n=1 Tax=Ricinus communis TaxID=3988 RepID=B9SRA1_RICCO|nr:conserved hypothetical protein [Ricinus communis]
MNIEEEINFNGAPSVTNSQESSTAAGSPTPIVTNTQPTQRRQNYERPALQKSPHWRN